MRGTRRSWGCSKSAANKTYQPSATAAGEVQIEVENPKDQDAFVQRVVSACTQAERHAVLSIQSEMSRAVLVGASRFPRESEHLLPIPQVVNNLDELKRLLTDFAVVGMAATCVQTFLDKDNIQELYEAIDVFANEAEETLLFYYTGHGLIGRSSSELHLATAGTIEAQAESNALSFDKIRHAIQNSTAKTKILILDCCFSGRAFEFMGPVSEIVPANLDLRGTFAIASAPPNRPALAPTGAKFTAFTGELVRVLNDGIDNGRDEISLEELYSVRSGPPARWSNDLMMMIAASVISQLGLEARARRFRMAPSELGCGSGEGQGHLRL